MVYWIQILDLTGGLGDIFISQQLTNYNKILLLKDHWLQQMVEIVYHLNKIMAMVQVGE